MSEGDEETEDDDYEEADLNEIGQQNLTECGSFEKLGIIEKGSIHKRSSRHKSRERSSKKKYSEKKKKTKEREVSAKIPFKGLALTCENKIKLVRGLFSVFVFSCLQPCHLCYDPVICNINLSEYLN